MKAKWDSVPSSAEQPRTTYTLLRRVFGNASAEENGFPEHRTPHAGGRALSTPTLLGHYATKIYR